MLTPNGSGRPSILMPTFGAFVRRVPTSAWVSRAKGIFARTIDAGRNWSVGTVPGAAKLDFRDVEAFSETTAYLLAARPGDSRIYKTADGGKTSISNSESRPRCLL